MRTGFCFGYIDGFGYLEVGGGFEALCCSVKFASGREGMVEEEEEEEEKEYYWNRGIH